jgi:hypothetical protein
MIFSHEKMRELLGMEDDAVIRNIAYDPDFDTYRVTVLTPTVPFDGKDNEGRGLYTVEGSPLYRDTSVTNYLDTTVSSTS